MQFLSGIVLHTIALNGKIDRVGYSLRDILREHTLIVYSFINCGTGF